MIPVILILKSRVSIREIVEAIMGDASKSSLHSQRWSDCL